MTALPQDIVDIVKSDTPQGFGFFYALVHNQMMPAHAKEWVNGIYDARKDSMGVCVEAFRGSTKTTTITQTFAAYRIAMEPHRANLLIQVGDDIAKNNTAAIAAIIEHNPIWLALFPHIVPDKPAGWGASGYNVMRTDMEYGEWTRMNAKRKDPTLLGVGIHSHAIIGKHPDGCLILDDVDDENTTRSIRELEKTRETLRANVFPGMTQETWPIVIGTPWTGEDTIALTKSTGRFKGIRTAVRKDSVLTWPEKFDEKEIQRQRDMAGEVEFARMFMLDLEAAKGHILKKEWIQYYPHTEIHANWPIFMGVDYASTSDRQKRTNADRDFFAICWGRITPSKTLIVEDGFAGRISQQEAEQRITALASAYPVLQLIGIEAIGKGEEFYNLLMSSPIFMPIMPIPSHSGLARSKGGRFEKVLAPLFQSARIMLSDKLTPFLRRFENEWVSWDGTQVTHDDTLDAVYMMAKAAEGHIAIPQTQAVYSLSPMYQGRIKSTNPYKELARGLERR